MAVFTARTVDTMNQAIQNNPEIRSDESLTTPAWFRFLVPSVQDLLFIALLLAMGAGAMVPRLLRDAGTGWHIRNGELILQTRQITRTDPFSAQMHAPTWYAWEWLYDAGIAAVHKKAGLNGVVWITAIVVAATFFLTLRFTLRRGASLPIALVLTMLAFSTAAIHLFARPHVVGWLFTVVWFEALDAGERGALRGNRIFLLPPLMLLWANVHGGFPIGIVLCVVFLVGGAIAWRKQSDERRIRTGKWLSRLAAATGLSLLATFINPYGYKLHVHIYEYLSDRFLMDHIEEFGSPNFHGVAQQCFVILLLITFVAMAAAARKVRISHLLVLVFAAYSGLYASRNLPISALLIVLIIAPILSQEVDEAGKSPSVLGRIFRKYSAFAERMLRMENAARGHVWPIAIVVVGIVACLQGGRVGSRQLMNARFDDQRFPAAAVDFIQQHGIHDPIFTPDYWGGYLIYRLYPQNRVFIDDRHDFYGDPYLKQYLRVIHVIPGWGDVLAQENVRWILVPPDSSLANILPLKPQWRVVFEDERGRLFERQE
jgi:hypothetical protein